MTPSTEYRALSALRKPLKSQAGDMWLCRRLGIVRVFNAHKRGQRRGLVNNSFHLYHWGKQALYCRPCDWRDNDPNSCPSDPAIGNKWGGMGSEEWEYVGNIFDLLPYSAIAVEP